PNSTTTYGETFTQPPDNLTRRLSTASSNHGSENGTSNGRKKNMLPRAAQEEEARSRSCKKQLEVEKKKPKMNGFRDKL
ncbi:hypothetical protein AZE42_08707, partial [Rhizopogon vesiculosus]